MWITQAQTIQEALVVAGDSLFNAACVPFAEYQPDGGRPGWNSSAKAADNSVALTLSDANQQESLQEMRQRFISRLQQVGGWEVEERGAAWRALPPLHCVQPRSRALPARSTSRKGALVPAGQGQVAHVSFLRQFKIDTLCTIMPMFMGTFELWTSPL